MMRESRWVATSRVDSSALVITIGDRDENEPDMAIEWLAVPIASVLEEVFAFKGPQIQNAEPEHSSVSTVGSSPQVT